MSRMVPTQPPRRLPAYDPLWSDGCSLAPFLPERWRSRFQDWTLGIIANDPELAREMRYICEAHDKAYYYGGTKDQRLKADKEMRAKMKQIGAPYWFRHAAFRAIRMFGGPSWQISGVSWSYGGSFCKYGVCALIDRKIGCPEPAQEPETPLWWDDLWPFNEERCDCPEQVTLMPQERGEWDDQGVSYLNVKAWKCDSCDQIYTRREV